MQTRLITLFLLWICPGMMLLAQPSKPAGQHPKAELYYFHPTERCPIDQAIEESTRQIVHTGFNQQIKDGTLKFKVINTDDKSMSPLVNRFEINAQALYLVTFPSGRELKNDLTEFAFSNAKNNPAKFKSGLKEELTKALK